MVKNIWMHIMGQTSEQFQFTGHIKSVAELGKLIRTFRKQQNLTLEKVSGLSNLGMRFISELERGKETKEIGKVFTLLNNLGLELIIKPRYSK